MPFKSEKQRRYLWLKHPEVAKRWAHEYPQKGKLPMYADNNKKEDEGENEAQKEARIALVRGFLAPVLAKYAVSRGPIARKTNSILGASNELPAHTKNAQEIFVDRVGNGAGNVTKTPGNMKKGSTAGMLKAGGRGAEVKELVDVLRKYAVVLKPGPEILKKLAPGALPPEMLPQTNLTGKSYSDWLRNINGSLAQSRMNSLIPPPIGSQNPPQNQPVATFPGMGSAPQAPAQPQAPPDRSQFARGNDGILNTIGKLSPFGTQNGQISSGIGKSYGNLPNTPTSFQVG